MTYEEAYRRVRATSVVMWGIAVVLAVVAWWRHVHGWGAWMPEFVILALCLATTALQRHLRSRITWPDEQDETQQ